MDTRMETPRIRRNSRPAGPGLALLLLLLLLAACAPVAVTPPASTAAERAAQNTAFVIFHRMQLGYLETGSYTTNVLVDVDLPQGMRWTIEAFPGESYELWVSDDLLPGIHWEVTPGGVRRVQNVSSGQRTN
jgi:hypothetical protein